MNINRIKINEYKEIAEELEDINNLTEHNFQRFEKYQRNDS